MNKAQLKFLFTSSATPNTTTANMCIPTQFAIIPCLWSTLRRKNGSTTTFSDWTAPFFLAEYPGQTIHFSTFWTAETRNGPTIPLVNTPMTNWILAFMDWARDQKLELIIRAIRKYTSVPFDDPTC